MQLALQLNNIPLSLESKPDSCDTRVNVGFNPDDGKGCYTQLFNQAVERLKEISKTESTDLSLKRLELLYASNVLNRVTTEEVTPMLQELEKYEKTLGSLSKNLTTDWIQAIGKEEGETNPPVDEIKNAINKTRETSRNARKMINEKTKQGVKTEISKESKEMLKLVPTDKAVDLKQLVLKMLNEDQPPAGILESALKNLSELFMNDKVQIKVELPHTK
jgi:hypothetical protein